MENSQTGATEKTWEGHVRPRLFPAPVPTGQHGQGAGTRDRQVRERKSGETQMFRLTSSDSRRARTRHREGEGDRGRCDSWKLKAEGTVRGSNCGHKEQINSGRTFSPHMESKAAQATNKS